MSKKLSLAYVLPLAVAAMVFAFAACSSGSSTGSNNDTSSSSNVPPVSYAEVQADAGAIKNIEWSATARVSVINGQSVPNLRIQINFEGNPANANGLDSMSILLNERKIPLSGVRGETDYEKDTSLVFTGKEYCDGQEYPVCLEIRATNKVVLRQCKNFKRDPNDSFCATPSSNSNSAKRFQQVGGNISLSGADKCVNLSAGTAAATGNICIAGSGAQPQLTSTVANSIKADIRSEEDISNPSSLSDFPLSLYGWETATTYLYYGANNGLYYAVCTTGSKEDWDDTCYLLLTAGPTTAPAVKIWKVVQ
jgi:hypothetical protein